MELNEKSKEALKSLKFEEKKEGEKKEIEQEEISSVQRVKDIINSLTDNDSFLVYVGKLYIDAVS